MNKLLLTLAALLVAGCVSVPRPATTLTHSGPPPYEAWARVLTEFVDAQGRVDFAAIARHRGDLDRFVSYVYDIGPNNRPELFPSADHVLAFHINAYNALALHQVIEAGIPVSLAGMRKLSFFYFSKVRVGGETISLYDYENKVIRALGEPRIHFALNCMSISCPRLPREPFLPETLDAQLTREAGLFLGESRNVRIDVVGKTLKLSAIFEFHREDFLEKAPSLAVYVNRYRQQQIVENYAVEFIPYDWTVNRQP